MCGITHYHSVSLHSLCVLFNKSLHIKSFKIVKEEAPSSGELDSDLGSENQFSLLCPSAPNLTMLKRKQRWNYFKELKPSDRSVRLSHCFTGWRRELLHVLRSTNETGQHPRKEWECSTQVWERDHLGDGQRPVGILDTTPICGAFQSHLS